MVGLLDSVVDQLAPETLDALQRLPAKRRLYCLALAVPNSSTYGRSIESAESAGYSNPKQACELVESTELARAAILYITRDLQKALEPFTLCDAAWIQRRLSVWAESTILDFGTVGEDDGLFTVDLRAVAGNPELASRVESIEVKDTPWGRVQKIKLVSPATIIQMLGRHTEVGAWKDTLEVTTGDRAERIQRAALRAIEDRKRLGAGAIDAEYEESDQ